MERQSAVLRLLGIFHFVFAGVVFLATLIPLVWMLLVNAWWPSLADGTDNFQVVFGSAVAVIITGFVLLLGWGMAVALVVAGRHLLMRRNLIYCQAVAAVSCLLFPLGTILGVATLVVTTNEQSRQLD